MAAMCCVRVWVCVWVAYAWGCLAWALDSTTTTQEGSDDAAVTSTTTSTTTAPTSAPICDRVEVGSPSTSIWRVACASANNQNNVEFDSQALEEIVVGPYQDLAVASTESKNQIIVSKALAQIDDFTSSTQTRMSIALSDNTQLSSSQVALSATAFANLSSLETLNLNGFQIYPSRLELVLPNTLKKISIENCSLENFDIRFVDGNAPVALTTLKLSGNKLTSIPRFVFSSNSPLSTLDLSQNRINQVDVTSAEQSQLADFVAKGVLQMDNQEDSSFSNGCDGTTSSIKTTTFSVRVCVGKSHPPLPPGDDGKDHKKDDKDKPPKAEFVKNGSGDSHRAAMLVTMVVLGIMAGVLVILGAVVAQRHFQLRRGRAPKTPKTPTGSPWVLNGAAAPGNAGPHTPKGKYFGAPRTAGSSTTRDDSSVDYGKHEDEFVDVVLAQPVSRRDARAAALPELAVEISKCITDEIPVLVNGQQYLLCGTIAEPIAASSCILVKCFSVANPEQKCMAKIKTSCDIAKAKNEYKSCVEIGSGTTDGVVQAVDFEPNAEIGGLHCSVFVMEMGHATLLHFARAEMDRSLLNSVAEQVVGVVHLLKSFHDNGYVHGAVELENLVFFRDQNGVFTMKLVDLKNTARIGDVMHITTFSCAEYCPPEMACLINHAWNLSSRASLDSCLVAQPSYDVWCLGILMLKLYIVSKWLEELAYVGKMLEDNGSASMLPIFERIAQPDFNLDRSIEIYVLHEPMKDLIRQCLNRNPSQRPSLDAILLHRALESVVTPPSDELMDPSAP